MPFYGYHGNSTRIRGGAGSPLASPASSTGGSDHDAMGGAWGGSEYMGGGYAADIYEAAHTLYVNKSNFTMVMGVKALLSVGSLICIILLLCYVTGTMESTTAGTVTTATFTSVLLAVSVVLDVAVAACPEMFAKKEEPPKI